MESDYIVLVKGVGVIYVEVKRTGTAVNMTKATAQIDKVKRFVDAVSQTCLGINLPCAKVNDFRNENLPNNHYTSTICLLMVNLEHKN